LERGDGSMSILAMINDIQVQMEAEGIQIKEIVMNRHMFIKLKSEILPTGNNSCSQISIPKWDHEHQQVHDYMVSYTDRPGFIMEVK
jgi:hypothetical protein